MLTFHCFYLPWLNCCSHPTSIVIFSTLQKDGAKKNIQMIDIFYLLVATKILDLSKCSETNLFKNNGIIITKLFSIALKISWITLQWITLVKIDIKCFIPEEARNGIATLHYKICFIVVKYINFVILFKTNFRELLSIMRRCDFIIHNKDFIFGIWNKNISWQIQNWNTKLSMKTTFRLSTFFYLFIYRNI